MTKQRRCQSGYSLAEMLVVVAIVGVMSLVLVPQFILYQQSSKIKGALQMIASDVRASRQVAISRYIQVRIEFTSSKRYSFSYRTTPSSATWNILPISVLANPNKPLATAVAPEYRDLPAPLYFVGSTFGDVDGNGKADILFNSDGSITNPDPLQFGGTVTIGSPWTKMVFDRVVVTVTGSGGVTSAMSHS